MFLLSHEVNFLKRLRTFKDGFEYFHKTEECKNVKAHLPKNNAPELNLPLLPDVVNKDYSLKAAKKFAYSKFENLKENFPEGKGMATIQSILDVLEVGVECGYKFASKNNKIILEDDALNFANEINQISEYDKGRWYGRIEGYNAASKTYGEEDLRKAYQQGIEDGNNNCYYEDSFIQSLKQNKTPTWFVAETELLTTDTSECIGMDGEPNHVSMQEYVYKLSLINNREYLVGTYIFE